ncbi:serine aminopeptidase domain-containing protein [Shinella sp.]|uniref:serine aminopeptidase domain-containing protein n=1 Tax=Shinella sp. TaxID=1870904 RepID=UPI0029A47EB1|nr:alpha/beta hydrolase [Shinella sp.]MDX3973963.1 alpha/beta hydrolase [Shinella sp.]
MSGDAKNGAVIAAESGSEAHEAAYPVAFSGIMGLFKPASDTTPARDLAVLFLAPWGIDELCTRKFFRIIAETLAEDGIASLRFDYPGTANALDAPEAVIDVASWTDAAIAGAEALRNLSGAANVVVLGFGLGAAIALRTSERAGNLAGLALLAPVVAGRRYLRELSVWSAVVDEGVGVAPHMRDTAPGTIAGLSMPQGIVATLSTLTADAFAGSRAEHVFFAARPDNTSDRQLRDRLAEGAATMRDFVFRGYDKLVSNPLGQEIPADFLDAFPDWLKSLAAYQAPIKNPPAPPSGPAVLTAGTIRETALRFGPGGRLIGTLSEPATGGGDATVVLLTTGYDHQGGWARSGVDLARRLAANGITAFRFDSAGVGDSPPVPGRREEVLYDETQIDDMAAVGEFLDDNGRTGPALLFGRCSGAYVAFRAAAADARWAGCIVVNPYAFRWLKPPSAEVVNSAPRALGDYSQKALKLDTIRRLVSGDIDMRAAARNIGQRVAQRLSKRLAPLLGPLLATERLERAVHADFRALSQRAGRTCLVYSVDDPGLDNLYVHFGNAVEGLAAYPNITLHILPDTDHNVTPRVSREQLFDIVEQAATSLSRTR